MEKRDIQEIADHCVYQGNVLRGKVEETHISWVILTRHYAFKFKKPLNLGFLDFSSLPLRKSYCEKELQLNRRFSDIYLSVLPVHKINNVWNINDSVDRDTTDYCVVMKRLSTAKRMDNMIRRGVVQETAMKVLATQVATFHKRAEKIFERCDIEKLKSTFNDIATITAFAYKNIAPQFEAVIHQSIDQSNQFLQQHRARLQQRIDHGLKRDLHGDLHCGNIFLYRSPVLFDCIEFNDGYRQIDVLYEVAFLCMDLEAFHKHHLANRFIAEYKNHFPAFQEKEDHRLFIYFKALRANIRAKVHAMQANQSDDPSITSHQAHEAGRYLSLMSEYLAVLRRPMFE